MQLKVQKTFETLKFDVENELHLVLSVTAPKIDWQAARAPIAIIAMVDTSGSMRGEKLEYAKQSVTKLIDHMAVGDFFGFGKFSYSGEMISKPVEITPTSKTELKSSVMKLQTEGDTNFADGLLKALDAAQKADFPKGMMVRVIMLTDGQPTCGVATSKASILALMNANLGTAWKASVSAFGYGASANQDLLGDLATASNGNYAFIEKAEDALPAFAKELGGLASVYAQNLVVKVSPRAEIASITSVLGDVKSTTDAGGVTIKIPDIYGEEERNIVLALKLLKAPASATDVNFAAVEVSYDTLDKDLHLKSQSQSQVAQITFVAAGEEQKQPTESVDKIVALAQLLTTQLQAEEFAKVGDFKSAHAAFQRTGMSLRSRKLDFMAASAVNIGSSYSNTMLYNSSNASRNSIKKGLDRSYGVFSSDTSASDELGALFNDAGVQASVTNSVQDALIKEFEKKAVDDKDSKKP